jgi:hypothetical protein
MAKSSYCESFIDNIFFTVGQESGVKSLDNDDFQPKKKVRDSATPCGKSQATLTVSTTEVDLKTATTADSTTVMPTLTVDGIEVSSTPYGKLHAIATPIGIS